MLQAFLKGKLSREQENLEDLLTSSVFGLLAYLPPESGLLPLLRLAMYEDGTAVPLLQASGVTVTSMEFWPTYQTDGVGPTEPDVIVHVVDMIGRKHSMLIEVKLWSGKSSGPGDDAHEIRDQLAREWCVLIDRCKSEGSQPHLIYVTADPRYPALEIDQSIKEFTSKRVALSSEFPLRCARVSWTAVVTAFRNSPELALRDVSRLCERLDLVPFGGIPALSPTPLFWRFSARALRFNFSLDPVRVTWGFQ
jgi:hypothetical protein